MGNWFTRYSFDDSEELKELTKTDPIILDDKIDIIEHEMKRDTYFFDITEELKNNPMFDIRRRELTGDEKLIRKE